ncbi:MAG: UDP-glucose 4-epimerase GalE [Acidobacteriota bacterium]|nr:UDP-glucose 4-epimerase GalE [Acidobacteriota bacterium]
MKVLVTGGAGYIGSVLTEKLLKNGFSVVVYDNLSTGSLDNLSEGVEFFHGDILDRQKLREIFLRHKFEAVFHLASCSIVSESVENPLKYYRNNLVGGINLLEAMMESGVEKIIFSSSAAVYGEPQMLPIDENHPTNPINAYGKAKLAFEKVLEDFQKAYGLKFVSLRYFNAAGASELHGENHHPETHLIPLVLQVALGKRESIEVFGGDYPTRDGTCVRDYIHVLDLVEAHVKALDSLCTRRKSEVYNLGCGGEGFTVLEVINTASKVTGKEIKTVFRPRRVGDPAVLIASSKKIENDLKWCPKFQSLEEIIESSWRWMKKRDENFSFSSYSA